MLEQSRQTARYTPPHDTPSRPPAASSSATPTWPGSCTSPTSSGSWKSAETDFLRTLGLSVSWREDGVKWGFPRVSASCDFQKPAQFEDVLTIAVTVEKRRDEVGELPVRLHEPARRAARGRADHRGVLPRHSSRAGIESLEIPADIRAKLEA